MYSEVNDYILDFENYATYIGCTDVTKLRYYLTFNLTKDNEWCLFHQLPCYWIQHFLTFKLDVISIDDLKISDTAKIGMKSILPCKKCNITTQRQAIYRYLEFNYYNFNNFEDWGGDMCKHFII